MNSSELIDASQNPRTGHGPTPRRSRSAARRSRTVSSLSLLVLASLGSTAEAQAVTSAEIYSLDSYRYGRFEARINFPAGEGVVGSFFLWKHRSEVASVFWNELDFEKIGANCELQLNSIYGLPQSGHDSVVAGLAPCGSYHTYTFEWTPEYIAWLVDGTEVRRDTGPDAEAYALHAEEGLQFRFNIWPGDASFGGVFSPDVLPVHQYIAWVRYFEYTPGGAEGDFTLAWHENFDEGVPATYARGSWASPKGLSTHSPTNVTAISGTAVLSLTEDGAEAFMDTPPEDSEAEPTGPKPPTSSGGPGGGKPIPVGGGEEPDEEEDSASGGGCSLGNAESRGGLALALVGLVWLLRRSSTKLHQR